MQLTVQELAALVGGQFAFDPERARIQITGAAAIAEAGASHVTFFGNAKYLPALRTCQAAAALVPTGFSETIRPLAIEVENPSLAFATLVEKFAPEPVRFSPGVHPTAIIGEGVVLGAGVSVQPFALIEAGARIGARTVVGAHGYIGHDAQIGEDCLLHPRVTVGARCVLGSRLIVHSGVVIGSDGFGFEFAGGKHVKIPQIGFVQIDDDVEIGANSTIDRARFGRTWVGEGTKIDNLVQIAHNVVIGKHCILVSQVAISGSTRLGNYVTMAGQVGTVGHIEIGDQVTVGAQSGVSKNLAAKGFYIGTPAIPAHKFRDQVAYIRRLDRLNARVKALEQLPDSKGKSLGPEL